jgi:hypothetical protein
LRSAENIFLHKHFDRTVSLVQAQLHCGVTNFQVNSNGNLGVAIMAWTREHHGIHEMGRLKQGNATNVQPMYYYLQAIVLTYSRHCILFTSELSRSTNDPTCLLKYQ